MATASQGTPLCFRQPPGQTRLPAGVSQHHPPTQVFVGSPVTGLLCRRGLHGRETIRAPELGGRRGGILITQRGQRLKRLE